MHADEVRATEGQVRRLLTEQMPQWADLELTQLGTEGTDHVLFRLGDDLLVRMPKIGWAVDQAERDARWLPQLAPHLPVPVPAPFAVGEPGAGFPWPWSVVPWIDGDIAGPAERSQQPGNLIVRDGRLAAVIDFGALGLGDPAPDVAAAFWTFRGGARRAYREAIGYDEATWRRARGWALLPSLTGLSYYRHTFPKTMELARGTIDAVLEDMRAHT